MAIVIGPLAETAGTTMGQPGQPVSYDFNAAYTLMQVLASANDKLGALISLRAVQRSSCLGSPGSDNWQGRRRDVFEHEFAPEQHRLVALADDVKRLLAAVEHVTEQARSINSKANAPGQ